MARTAKRHGVLRRVEARWTAASGSLDRWVADRDPDSAVGVAVEAWRRYRAIDGPLQSALLSLYLLVAVLPAVMVMEEYLDSHPAALANHLVHHYGLNASTAALLRDVLTHTRTHELGSALLAIAGSLFFGLNFGRVLQLVHTRAWEISLPTRLRDQGLYAGVLLGFYGLLLVLLVQLTELRGSPRPVGILLALGWFGLLVIFFVWTPWLLTHRRLTRRDLLPGAVLTSAGLVALMLVSSFVMQDWVNLYSRDYGGLGVVLAIYFWIALGAGVVVAAAGIGPPLARRRARRPAPVR